MNEEPSDSQKPKKISKVRKPKKPVSKIKKTISKTNTKKNKTVEDGVHRAIRQALLSFYSNAAEKRLQNLDLNHLLGMVSEYLDSFILLGFDTKGQKASIMHATTQVGRDALVEHLRTTFIQMIGQDNS